MVQDLIPESTDEDDRLILTAAHLFDGVEDGTRVLYALAGPEPASTDGQHCGTVRRRVPLNHLPSITVDAAVIKPRRSIECSNRMDCGEPTGVRDLWVVDDQRELIAVRKQGAQTLMTRGELMPIAAAHHMEDVRTRYESGWWAYGTGSTPFAANGDSGAIVIDDARAVVGMAVAVEGPDAYAGTFVHGIKQIFSALQIALP